MASLECKICLEGFRLAANLKCLKYLLVRFQELPSEFQRLLADAVGDGTPLVGVTQLVSALAEIRAAPEADEPQEEPDDISDEGASVPAAKATAPQPVPALETPEMAIIREILLIKYPDLAEQLVNQETTHAFVTRTLLESQDVVELVDRLFGSGSESLKLLACDVALRKDVPIKDRWLDSLKGSKQLFQAGWALAEKHFLTQSDSHEAIEGRLESLVIDDSMGEPPRVEFAQPLPSEGWAETETLDQLMSAYFDCKFPSADALFGQTAGSRTPSPRRKAQTEAAAMLSKSVISYKEGALLKNLVHQAPESLLVTRTEFVSSVMQVSDVVICVDSATPPAEMEEPEQIVMPPPLSISKCYRSFYDEMLDVDVELCVSMLAHGLKQSLKDIAAFANTVRNMNMLLPLLRRCLAKLDHRCQRTTNLRLNIALAFLHTLNAYMGHWGHWPAEVAKLWSGMSPAYRQEACRDILYEGLCNMLAQSRKIPGSEFEPRKALLVQYLTDLGKPTVREVARLGLFRDVMIHSECNSEDDVSRIVALREAFEKLTATGPDHQYYKELSRVVLPDLYAKQTLADHSAKYAKQALASYFKDDSTKQAESTLWAKAKKAFEQGKLGKSCTPGQTPIEYQESELTLRSFSTWLVDTFNCHDGIFRYLNPILVIGSKQKPIRIGYVAVDGFVGYQLIKTGDDLRLDHSILSLIDQANQLASQQDAVSASYDVTPLSLTIGVIEWLQNTLTLKKVYEEVQGEALQQLPAYKTFIRLVTSYNKNQGERRKAVKQGFSPMFSNYALTAPADYVLQVASELKSSEPKHVCPDPSVSPVAVPSASAVVSEETVMDELFGSSEKLQVTIELSESPTSSQDNCACTYRHSIYQWILDRSRSADEYAKLRQNFIKGLGAMSACCYDLEIGDRHLDNILVDASTAAPYMIDFGYSLKCDLPVPEVVPFRYTSFLSNSYYSCHGAERSGQQRDPNDWLFTRQLAKTLRVMYEMRETVLSSIKYLAPDEHVKRADHDKSAEASSPEATAAFSTQAVATTRASAADDSVVEDDRITKVRERIELVGGSDTVLKLWLARLRASRWEGVRQSVSKNGIYKRYADDVSEDLEGLSDDAELAVARQLVYMAKDPRLLFRMWIGWSPQV